MEIKDNVKVNYKEGICHKLKVANDYKSHIDCLNDTKREEITLNKTRDHSKKFGKLGIQKNNCTFDIFREYCNTENDYQPTKSNKVYIIIILHYLIVIKIR